MEESELQSLAFILGTDNTCIVDVHVTHGLRKSRRDGAHRRVLEEVGVTQRLSLGDCESHRLLMRDMQLFIKLTV